MAGKFWLAFGGLLAGAVLAAGPQARAATYPYAAFISSDDVYVRSGPGKNYYPTGKLKRGDRVEVYRQDPGGWFAIRPPQASFSWVNARQIDLGKDGLATVNTQRTVARVGSLLSDIREVIQVRLDKGESVELADNEPSADGKWYKITPPAGEFRWIHKDFLSRRPVSTQFAAAGTESSSSAEDDDSSEGETDEDEDDRAESKRAAHRRERRSSDDIRLTGGDEVSPAPRRSARPDRPVATPRDTARTFSAVLADIDLDLSAMVAEEISLWSFDDLRMRVQRAVDAAPTALERGQARLLSSRIDRFSQLKDRHDALADTNRRNLRLGRSSVARANDSQSRFDAVGRLSSVGPRRDGTPPFALIDASGRVVSYVTPAPGINLRPYVDRQVGLNGQRGLMAEQQKPHISAQHITVLSDTIRR